MRPIDADALIEKCGGWYVDECTESGFIGTLENLLVTEPTIQPEVLACGNGELIATPEPPWIPVSERLPEKSANYLVTVRWYREDDIDINVYEYNAWHKEWNDGDMCGQKVIAWMPLPEAYKPNK